MGELEFRLDRGLGGGHYTNDEVQPGRFGPKL